MQIQIHPCLCLCLRFTQITRTTPLLLIILHLLQIGLTDGLTFMVLMAPSFALYSCEKDSEKIALWGCNISNFFRSITAMNNTAPVQIVGR